jgi:beta-lactamase class A
VKSRLLIGLVAAIVAIGPPALATPSGVFTDDDGLPSEQYLEHLYEIGVVQGCGAGMSCPLQTLMRAEAAAMVFRIMATQTIGTPDVEPTVDTFVDDDTLWDGVAEPLIEALVSAGVVNGCDAGHSLFCPLRQMSRGEAITVLFRAFQLPVPAGASNPFIDVGSVYYHDAVRAGVAAGLVDSSTQMFRGELPITRGEFAIWLSGAAGLDICRANPFTEGRQAALVAEFPGQRFTAFAWDAETGCTYALNAANRQPTASVFKVMVMAGTLLEAQLAGRAVTGQELAWLQPMISVSANEPVRSLWSHFGGAPWFNDQADTFGLDETTIVGDYETVWGRTSTSAGDQVDLLRQILFREFGSFDQNGQDLAWELMTDIDPAQRWGVGTYAPTGSIVAQKNGFAGVTANSVGAVVLPSGRGYALAVLSTGWGNWPAGVPAVDTIAGWVHESLGH